MEARRVALFGATGSVGRQTLDVLRTERGRFELTCVSAGERLDDLAKVIRDFDVPRAVVKTESHRRVLADLVASSVEIDIGDTSLENAAGECDIAVNAVLGFAGLPVTLGALAGGRRLALANKESLIAAGPLVAQVRETPGAELWPVDSEHCAIHQCLAGSEAPFDDVRRVWLTASGGPFYGRSREELRHVTKEEALRHPTWTMGEKITIDSSTLMNKGLEVLEASALFDLSMARIEVIVHPQSIVHSMVEYVDGSIIAQLSSPDMRLPIAYCLGMPERLDHHYGPLDFASGISLSFEAPDRSAFPALDLAYEAGRRGGAAPTWLSAANEVAVDAFLHGVITWVNIVDVVERTMDNFEEAPLRTLDDLMEHDRRARSVARVAVTAC